MNTLKWKEFAGMLWKMLDSTILSKTSKYRDGSICEVKDIELKWKVPGMWGERRGEKDKN